MRVRPGFTIIGIGAALVLAVGASLAEQPPEPGTSGAEAIASQGLARASRLQGTVFRDRGRKIVGATVRAWDERDPSRLFLTSSDEHGSFRIEGLADGLYRVEVERDGYAPAAKEKVEVRFPFRAVIELTLQTAEPEARGPRPPADSEARPLRIEGEVRERGAGALDEARLRFVQADGRADPRELTTGPEGTFTIEDLAPGPWRIEVRRVGFLYLRTVFDLRRDIALRIDLVRQPPRHEPSPLELMPREQPIPPAGLEHGGSGY